MKRCKEFDAHRYLRKNRHLHTRPQRRIDDKDWRKVAAFAVVVAVVVTLWATFQ